MQLQRACQQWQRKAHVQVLDLSGTKGVASKQVINARWRCRAHVKVLVTFGVPRHVRYEAKGVASK